MALLVPSSSLPLNESPVVAEVNMGDDSAAPTIRATVVQASTVFYDTPATLDLGDIARAKFDFDVVGHYSRPEVLSLIVRDHPANPVTFTSASANSQKL